jgi:hypothetical protein
MNKSNEQNNTNRFFYVGLYSLSVQLAVAMLR